MVSPTSILFTYTYSWPIIYTHIHIHILPLPQTTMQSANPITTITDDNGNGWWPLTWLAGKYNNLNYFFPLPTQACPCPHSTSTSTSTHMSFHSHTSIYPPMPTTLHCIPPETHLCPATTLDSTMGTHKTQQLCRCHNDPADMMITQMA